jgi:membrane protein implicated in regulation of membrane protease activity
MGLCLAGIEDAELQRLRFRRLRLISPLAIGPVILALLGGSLTAGQAGGMTLAAGGLAAALQIGSYIVAGVLSLSALLTLLYTRAIVRRALRDRSTDPVARRATIRGLIRAREGGWPVRLRCDDGRWLWLTGSRQVLAPIQGRLAHDAGKRPYRLTVAVIHHPRSRVIKEISGLKIEALDWAWVGATAPEASPA